MGAGLSYLPMPVWAQSDNNTSEKGPEEKQGKKGIIDTSHEVISKGLLISAKWLDSFFRNEQYEAEENRSTLRLTSSFLQEEGEDSEFDVKARLRIVAPMTKDKLQLVFAGEADDDPDFYDAPEQSGKQPNEGMDQKETTASLWYFFKTSVRDNLSARVGFRRRNGKAVVYSGPRYRHLWKFENWSVRFTESVRWFSDTGWESITSLDFERPFHKTFLYRTHIEGTWYEERDGYYPNLTFSLYQYLSKKRALEYSLINDFETRPTDRLKEITLRVRYRQSIWRKWLFLEIIPQVRFPEDQDYDAISGIGIKLEAVFGNIM